MILFPNYLMHTAYPFHTSGERRSFSLNIELEEKSQTSFMTKNQLNVLGEKLENCSLDPLTGWYRDGCCNTDENDIGTHTVCAKVNDDFLKFCKDNGNDLITPRPEYNFVGLKKW